MFEEDCFIETPMEATVIVPKASLINNGAAISFKINPSSFKHLTITKALNKGKFPVFLAQSESSGQSYAMKLFVSQDEASEECFLNESRFERLIHPNIIRQVYSEQNRTIKYDKSSSLKASFILTEFAPHGDFFDFVKYHHEHLTDKLIRTYFRQLIEGLEYLHSRNIAHLDLKLENLLIGDNFTLKITDFDLSCFASTEKIKSGGTKFYRAPELANGRCKNALTTDIYSAGIILFALKTGGKFPHTEKTPYKNIDLYSLLKNKDQEFWSRHCQFQNQPPSFFSSEFKELFEGMVAVKPEERFSIPQIKNSKWYNGDVFSKDELIQHVQSFIHTN